MNHLGHGHISRRGWCRCPRSSSPRPGCPPGPCGAGARPAGRWSWPASKAGRCYSPRAAPPGSAAAARRAGPPSPPRR